MHVSRGSVQVNVPQCLMQKLMLFQCHVEKRFVVRAVPVSAILGSVRGGFLAFIGFKWELPVWSALASLLNCPAHNSRLYWALTSNQGGNSDRLSDGRWIFS